VSQDSDEEGPVAGVPYDGRLTKADGEGLWWDGLDPQNLYAQCHLRGREHFLQEIARVELLGAGGPLIFTRDTSGLVVNLPEKKPNEYAYALKIVPK
jgi:hypothetical protein